MARRRTVHAWLLLLAATSLGCPAFHQRERDVDRTPIVNTGAGASIIYPGQSPPTYQGPYHPKQHGQGSYGQPGQAQAGAPAGAPTSGAGSYGVPTPENTTRRSSGAPSGGGGSSITMIGGNTTEEERHQKIDEQPVWWKYVTLPFAVVAAPFVYVADQMQPEPEPGPEVPNLDSVAKAAPPPAPAPTDYETATLQRLEDELDQRQAAERGASSPPAPRSAGTVSTSPRPSTANTGGSALAAELAALQRAREEKPGRSPSSRTVASAPPQASPAPTRTPVATPGPDGLAPLAAASGHVDRDGDGRTDQWLFRENGQIVRELLDEDFDGRPDRTLHYDRVSHQVRAIEEDADHDGRPDTWTSLRDGSIVRRRADDNADGHVDTWSYYREGVLTRLERDATGDGFRDRVSHYEDGRLAREEQDDDADGLADVVKHYDASERIARLEEDTNGDGRIDVISHYDDGRLTRRELLDADLLQPAPSLTEHN